MKYVKYCIILVQIRNDAGFLRTAENGGAPGCQHCQEHWTRARNCLLGPRRHVEARFTARNSALVRAVFPPLVRVAFL